MIKKIYTTLCYIAYKEQRSQSIHLQQPYLESDQNTVRQFLFDKENIEEKKELLFTICEASLQNGPYVARKINRVYKLIS